MPTGTEHAGTNCRAREMPVRVADEWSGAHLAEVDAARARYDARDGQRHWATTR